MLNEKENEAENSVHIQIQEPLLVQKIPQIEERMENLEKIYILI